jgi:hypothetical protein
MPPRHAYWTILIDQRPTAFRAKDREDLLPTVHQLLRTNADVVMKWFARGRIWDSPEQADWARRTLGKGPREKRDRDWRPGGEHRDPRARFEKRRPQPRSAETRPAGSWPKQSPPARSRPNATRPHQSRPARSMPRGSSAYSSSRRRPRPGPGHRKPPDKD